jgi:hypothetical protein
MSYVVPFPILYLESLDQALYWTAGPSGLGSVEPFFVGS